MIPQATIFSQKQAPPLLFVLVLRKGISVACSCQTMPVENENRQGISPPKNQTDYCLTYIPPKNTSNATEPGFKGLQQKYVSKIMFRVHTLAERIQKGSFTKNEQ